MSILSNFLLFCSFRRVERGWGFFFWLNRFIFVTSNGVEDNPKFPFNFRSGAWLNVTSIVNGNRATIIINGTRLPTVEMKGDGSTEAGEKYVGLWCHRLIYVTVKSFSVKPCKSTITFDN